MPSIIIFEDDDQLRDSLVVLISISNSNNFAVAETMPTQWMRQPLNAAINPM